MFSDCMKLVWNNISASVFKMKWKCNSVQGCGNGCSQVWTIVMILQIISAACVVLVASEGENTPADSVADEVSHFSQYSLLHHRNVAPHFRRQLSHHEQKAILTDIQQNHRYQQSLVDPRSPTNSHQYPFSLLYPQQTQLAAEQSSALFPQAHLPISTQQSPVLLSLQQSPLSSPQFSSLFSQQPQPSIGTPESPLSTQSSPALLSLQNSPLSVHQSAGLFSLQPQTQQPETLLPVQQPPRTTQQSTDVFPQQPKSPLSTQQSPQSTQKSKEAQSILTTEDPNTEEHGTDIKVLQGVSNTEFTIQRSISDPVELQKVQLLELQREQERRERLKKLQEEQLRLIQEENERRLKEREEEDRRDEERRLKLQEQLRKIQEEKEKRRKQQEEEQLRLIQEREERLLKQQQEEQLRLIQEKERQKKEEEEEKLRLSEKRGKNEEKQQQQQQEPPLSSVIYAEPTSATNEVPKEIELQPSQGLSQTLSEGQSGIQTQYYGDRPEEVKLHPTTTILNQSEEEDLNSGRHQQEPNGQRPRQRARIAEESGPGIAPKELFLQNERQKLYYQLKEAQQQQQKKQATDEKQQTQESQQVTVNNRTPSNQIVQSKSDQRSAQQSKLSQLEKQLRQKQLQEQLQKQFQIQLLQRQDLLRQLKLAVSNAATPTSEDQIAPGPIAISGGNSSVPLFLANGQKIQVVQSSKQDLPLTDSTSRDGPLLPASSVSTATQRSPRILFEELAKGVLPPGADFEVIRHKQDGALEDVGKQLPQNLPQKKVTFVFLEEQADGSFKVKGVRGNNNGQLEGDHAPAGDVESIIKKIQEGDLKLPAPSNAPVLHQSKVPQLPTGLPPVTISQADLPQSTINSFPATPKPNSIIKTVSSSFNFHRHPGMEFLESVTLPPLYDIDSTQRTVSTVTSLTNKHTAQSELSTVHLSSPYSVEVHPTGQNSTVPVFAQALPSPNTQQSSTNPYINKSSQPTIPSTNIDQNTHQHQQGINSVTPVTPFLPTSPSVTFLPPNKHSLSQVTLYTTSDSKKEQFLPTDPSFVNPSQSYSSFFGPGNAPKQAHQKQETPAPGVIYANPTTEVPLLTTNTVTRHGTSEHQDIGPSDYTQEQQDFQQNVEASSLKTPTKVTAPPPQDILKEPDKLVPLDEDGSIEYQTKVEAPLSLAEVLKKEGLFAMAKFLRQSGLNNMLNDTGPYTVFAPTDRAFRNLLVQLGGPEKAEEKFRENPRLLSGLLLHHVIPGAFELSSLQDEMTGVSLAGTQLRVNTYTSQDVEWNDVQVVTINGARMSRDKHDIVIPQGIAHAVDRVMFPLPVGNIVQTLRSDRDRRFSKFLRAIQTSGLAETFSGNKVFTVFAPTDRAFSVVDADDVDQLLTDKNMSRTLVLRHTIPGTLYSAGMRFYQLRDAMEKGSTITLHKSNGHVKVNSANIVTQNVPATNGVIHAIDGLL